MPKTIDTLALRCDVEYVRKQLAPLQRPGVQYREMADRVQRALDALERVSDALYPDECGEDEDAGDGDD